MAGLEGVVFLRSKGFGGGRRIRTRGGSATTDFKSAALDRSASPPRTGEILPQKTVSRMARRAARSGTSMICALLIVLVALGLGFSPALASGGVVVNGFRWSFDPGSMVGRGVVEVTNLGDKRVPSPRVAVVLMDPLGNQISSAWGRPGGNYLPPGASRSFQLVLRPRLIPHGVRVMLLDESCGTCR